MLPAPGAPPRVTVIIATYNWSTVLPYSIGSVLSQTMGAFELLVVGDACTDDSADVVAAIGDSRARFINLPENTRHQSGPNNEGLRQARGELIAYLGHDDLWLPHHLQVMTSALDRSGEDMAYSLVAIVEPDGYTVRAAVPWPKYGWWSPPSGTVHRRSVTEALGGWRHYRDVSAPPEIDLWRRARAAGFQFTFVPRLGAIKFPASVRAGVYQTRPCHEQARWAGRIAAEPDLECTVLAHMVMDSSHPTQLPYAELLRQCGAQGLVRLRRRLAPGSRYVAGLWRRRGVDIDNVRRFKGLE